MNCLYCNIKCITKGQYSCFQYYECENCMNKGFLIQYRVNTYSNELCTYWVFKEPYTIQVSNERKDIIIFHYNNNSEPLLVIDKIDEDPINFEKYINRFNNLRAFL